jgi:Flp pilus assembly protein TadD
MHGTFDKIRRFMPVSVIALGLGACATTSSTQPTQQVTVDSMLRVAELTRSGGDLVNAVGLYQRAHELAPQDERPLIALGKVFSQLGSPTSAAEAYRAAVAVAPSDVEARRGLGVALIATGQPEVAILELEKALDLAKDYRIYNSLGVAYDMIGDHASAQTYYNTGLTLSPGNLELSNNLGLSLALDGRYPEAIALLERIANEPSAPSRYRQNLALALGLAGERERARQVAETDLDSATAEKNLSYFDVLKGLGDHRTMAAALGVHMVGQLNTGNPAAGSAAMSPAFDNPDVLPQAEAPVAAPLAPVSNLETAPVEVVPQSGMEMPVEPAAASEARPIEATTPTTPHATTHLRPLPAPVAPAVVEEGAMPAAGADIRTAPLPAADIDAKPLDDFERESGGAEEPRPTSPARFEEPVQSRAVEHGPSLSALTEPAQEIILVGQEDVDGAGSCSSPADMVQLASAGGAGTDAAIVMLGYLAAGPSDEDFVGSGLSDSSEFAASRYAR